MAMQVIQNLERHKAISLAFDSKLLPDNRVAMSRELN